MWYGRISLGIREKNSGLMMIGYQEMVYKECVCVRVRACALMVTCCKSYFLREREREREMVHGILPFLVRHGQLFKTKKRSQWIWDIFYFRLLYKYGNIVTPRGGLSGEGLSFGVMLLTRFKVQRLLGAFNPLGPSVWGNLIAPWITRGALARNSLLKVCAPPGLVEAIASETRCQ